MPEDFFARLHDWSRYKLDILGKYLRVWGYHLQKRSDVLNYVDLCAGAGKYEEDGSAGSPLIAAETNEKFLQGKCRLVVIACEQDPEAFEKLEKVMELYTSCYPPQAVLFPDPFQDVLEPILQATRDNPTFVFLDSYGVKAIAAENLRPLLKDRSREPTELLVRVDSRLMARYSGWLTEKDRKPREERKAESFERLLKELEISEELREAYREGKAAKGDRTSELLDDYVQLFESRFRYVHYIPIRPDYFQAPKYYLVHGTDSPYGIARLNDVASTTEDEVFRDSMEARDGDQLPLFKPERKPRVKIRDAQEYVLHLLSSWPGSLTYVELQAELTLRFGPDLRDKDHRRAVQRLLDDGKIHITPPDQAIKPRTKISLASRTSAAPH